MKILVDAMGGDNAPKEIVKGCVEAVKSAEDFEILLLGDKQQIEDLLTTYRYSGNRISIRHTTEVITNNEAPTKAIKEKKDSSIVVGFQMLKEKLGDVFISAGSTGALMTGALFLLGRIRGVNRPALTPVVPSLSGGTVIADAGMNTTCKPINYMQFALMGKTYIEMVLGKNNPRIGLVNVGSEEEKGLPIIKQVNTLLKESNFNFIGNIEGNDIATGKVDVAVCDGFTGNVMLKMMEGSGKYMSNGLKKVFTANIVSKLAYMMLKSNFEVFKKSLDPNEFGGTPILGVNGIVYKCHGSCNFKAIKNTVLNSIELAKKNFIDRIREEIKELEVNNIGDVEI